MASLVKRLQNRPFHLIYGDNQRIGKGKMVEYMKSQGFSDALSNFTLSQFPGHPEVKGNGYVPYYMVFDHTGKLRYEHMCGKYHGGDGMKCIEWVDKLIAQVPAIYFGKVKFTHYRELVKDLETAENLSRDVKKVEAAQDEVEEGSEEAAELERIYAVLIRYRDIELQRVEELRATEPGRILGELKELKSRLKGTKLRKRVSDRYDELSKSDEHKIEKKIADVFQKYKKKLERGKALTKKQRTKIVSQAARALRKLTSKNPALPISASVKVWLAANGAGED